MGLSIVAYGFLGITGGWMFYTRQHRLDRPVWLRSLHYSLGFILVTLVLLLLGIGIVGTLGHYGTLGHSLHFPAGLAVVALVLLSAWSATQISLYPGARFLHLATNALLLLGLTVVSLTGWDVVQKYLP